MKYAFSIIAAILLGAACGSDVTGPSGGGTNPDTLEWEHTVLLRAEVFNTVPDPLLTIHWLEDGEVHFELQYHGDLWEYEMEGESGDSLWLSCHGWDEEWIIVTIFVDSVWVTSSGSPTGPGEKECSYVIP